MKIKRASNIPQLAGHHRALSACTATLLLLLMSSCAHSLTIESSPGGAHIVALNEQGKRVADLGKTPTKISTSAAAIQVEATGYYPSLLLLPSGGQALRARYSIPLIQQSQQATEKVLFETQPDVLDTALIDVLTLQTLINENKLKDAEARIKQMGDRYAFVSVFHILKGHYYVAVKNVNAAKESFEKALELNPKNEEARSMLALLRSQRAR